MNRLIFSLFLTVCFIFNSTNIEAQQLKKKLLSGLVVDYDNKPIKGARVFIDSLKTKAKTDKKGFYSIMVSPKNNLVTIFSANHGVIDLEYTGQDKINFVFPESTTLITKKEFSKMGYGSSNFEDEVDYSSYTDIFQLLKSKFPNLQVSGETVRLRDSGTSLTGGLLEPLFLVNGSQVSSIASINPADIKSIDVSRTKTSLYGSQSAGGVIKIMLKR